MSKTKFTLPQRLRSMTGHLEVLGSNGEFVVRDNKTHKIYILADNDKVTFNGTTYTVKLTYCTGKDKLNGNIGTLVTLDGQDEWGYTRHIFFWRMPAERADLQPWLDAYLAKAEVKVEFVCKPLLDSDGTFISGKLEAFHEQGMEGNIGWSVFDTQKHSYAALNMLEEGDKLTIFNEGGTRIIWQGTMTARRMHNLRSSCYDRRKKPTAETQFLIQSFFKALPCVLEKKNVKKK